MLPIVIFWNVALLVAIFGYAFVFYFYVTAPPMNFKYKITNEIMLIGLVVIGMSA